MFLENLCSPALLYLLFSSTQIIIDTFNRMYNTALMKLVVAIVFTFTLNLLCSRGLSLVSWVIVFIPFILMSVITTMLLLVFGLSPFKGKMKFYKNSDLNNLNNLKDDNKSNNVVTTHNNHSQNTTHLSKNNKLNVDTSNNHIDVSNSSSIISSSSNGSSSNSSSSNGSSSNSSSSNSSSSNSSSSNSSSSNSSSSNSS
jgi:hypothetical protein